MLTVNIRAGIAGAGASAALPGSAAAVARLGSTGGATASVGAGELSTAGRLPLLSGRRAAEIAAIPAPSTSTTAPAVSQRLPASAATSRPRRGATGAGSSITSEMLE
jgi:hypothetical protein